MIPRIKICGVKHAEHVITAVQGGATAIGLNFVPPSSRYVGGVKEALELIHACASVPVEWAGLFVNPNFDELKVVLAAVEFQIIQLHGSESPEFVRRVKSRARGAKVWKAFRVATKDDLTPIADYDCDGVVLDSKVAGTFGGTGQAFDWNLLEGFPRSVPLILSGGLNPGNVANAIGIVNPDWVDVASGVESSPGEKCSEKILQFIKEAQRARET